MQEDSVSGVTLPGVRTFQGDMTTHKKPDTSEGIVFTVPKRETAETEDARGEKVDGFGNKKSLFDVGRAFSDDRIQEGTIVTDKKRRRMSVTGLARAALKEWWQKTSAEFEETTEKIEILKPKEVPTVRAAETRAEVVKDAASYTKQAPRDDFNKVIGKLRTFQGDAARAAEKAYTVKEVNTVAAPTWSKEVEKKTLIVPASVSEKKLTTTPSVPVVTEASPTNAPAILETETPDAKIRPERAKSVTHTPYHSTHSIPPSTALQTETVAPSVTKHAVSSRPTVPAIASSKIQTHTEKAASTPVPLSTTPQHHDPLQRLRENGVPQSHSHGTKPEKGAPSWTHIVEDSGAKEVVRVPDVPRVRTQAAPSEMLRPAPSPALDLRKIIEAQMSGKKTVDAQPTPTTLSPHISSHGSVPDTAEQTPTKTPPVIPQVTASASTPPREAASPAPSYTPRITEVRPDVPQPAPTPHSVEAKVPPQKAVIPPAPAALPTAPKTEPSPAAVTPYAPRIRQSIPESSPEEVDMNPFIDSRADTEVVTQRPQEVFVDPYEALEAEKKKEEEKSPTSPTPQAAPLVPPPSQAALTTQYQTPERMPFEFPIFKVVMITLVVLITGGLGVVTALYTAPLFTDIPETETPPEEIVEIPSYTNTTAARPLALGGSTTLFRETLASLSSEGGDGVVQYYPTLPSGSLATTPEILGVLAPNAPGSLVRALDPLMMLGSVPVSSGRAPFIVINAHNFDTAFAGMLTWEKTLESDLYPFFKTSLSPENAGDGLFKDALRSNRSIRVLRDTLGNERVVYAFINKKLIVITTTTEALSAVITNLK